MDPNKSLLWRQHWWSIDRGNRQYWFGLPLRWQVVFRWHRYQQNCPPADPSLIQLNKYSSDFICISLGQALGLSKKTVEIVWVEGLASSIDSFDILSLLAFVFFFRSVSTKTFRPSRAFLFFFAATQIWVLFLIADNLNKVSWLDYFIMNFFSFRRKATFSGPMPQTWFQTSVNFRWSFGCESLLLRR